MIDPSVLFNFESANEENIVIIENFISDSDLSKIYDYCYSINEWESQSVSNEDKISSSATMKIKAPEVHEIMQRYVDRVQQLVEFKFGRKLERGSAGIRRWDAGESQPFHADGESPNGAPNDTYIVDYGSIMYINDNYTGGEIHFPAYEIMFRPKRGTLIFFPSSLYYIHEVLPVISGVRYTSPHFWVPIKHRKLIEIAKNG